MYVTRVFFVRTNPKQKQQGKYSASADLHFRTGFRPLDSFIASRLVSQSPFCCNIVQTSRLSLLFQDNSRLSVHLLHCCVFAPSVVEVCLKSFTECTEVSQRTTNLFCLCFCRSLIQCQYVNNYMTVISIISSYA